MSDSTQRLPNLYQLLGLTALESDQHKITRALGKVQARCESLQSDPASKPDDQARLQRVLALGKKYLLDAQRKSVYDQQWSATYGTSQEPGKESRKEPAVEKVAIASASQASSSVRTSKSSSASSSTATAAMFWDMSALEALLPAADPHAAFDMAYYLRSSEVRDPLAAEADLRKLIALLGGEPMPVVAEPEASQLIGLEHLTSPDDSPAQSAGLAVASEPVAPSGIALPRSSPSSSPGSLNKRLQQKRQRSIVMGGLSLLAGVAALVLLGFYLTQPGGSSNQAELALNKPTPVKPPKPIKPPKSVTETVADTQPIDGQAAVTEATNTVTNSGLLIPGENMKPLEVQATPIPAETKSPEMKPADGAPTEVKPAEMKPAEMKPAEMKPAEPTPAQPTAPTEPAAPPAPAADVKLSAEDKAAWKKGMLAIRASLSQLDIPNAEKQLTEIQAAIKNSEQRSQHERLQQVAGLVKTARQAMVDAIAGLSGADTFKAGSTVVSFIEGDENRLVVRVSGRRYEYKLADIPTGMGRGLIDLKLDVAHANSLAAKGAYILVHPKNEAALKQGKQMLNEAAAAGAISNEVAHFYEDEY